MFISFDIIHERDGHTHKHTDRHRMTTSAALMDSIVRQKPEKISGEGHSSLFKSLPCEDEDTFSHSTPFGTVLVPSVSASTPLRSSHH